ncbi:MAG: dihydrodipicolinate synthase family protein [Promethearchaeota archaeon]
MQNINGVIVPSITFFNDRLEINNELNSLLIRHILLNGADGVFLFGNTGEGIEFIEKVNEKSKFLDLALQYTKNKTPILLGAFGNNTEQAINQIELLGKEYKFLNFVITPPISKRLERNKLIGYFENILGSLTLNNQIFLYNNPHRFAKNNISGDTVKPLFKFDNLKGIKDTTTKLENTKGFIEFISENFAVYCGEEINYSAFLKFVPIKLRKYSGLVPSISNISYICKKMFQRALDGEDSQLDKLQRELHKQQKGIYDTKGAMGREPRGLKQAFYTLYKNKISLTEKEVTFMSKELRRILEQDKKDMIKNTVENMILSEWIFKVK